MPPKQVQELKISLETILGPLMKDVGEIMAETRVHTQRLDDIGEHLKQLNGSVSRHEQSISTINGRCSLHQPILDKVMSIETLVEAQARRNVAQATERVVNAQWHHRLLPVAKWVAIAALPLFGEHAGPALKAMLK